MLPIDELAQRLAIARNNNQLYEAVSLLHQLDEDEAYAVQRSLTTVLQRERPACGFKSAVNAPALQQALGIDHPIMAMLFGDGAHSSGDVIARSAYRTLVIETEIGFRTKALISHRLTDPAELRNYIASCAAMIELADPGFGRQKFNACDLIAANGASAGFIEGKLMPVETEVNAVQVTLQREGHALHAARANELMGDQWRALLWLVNETVQRGYEIPAGSLLMTGALGKAHPATPGAYVARFGVLGEIAFAVVD